MRASTGLWEPRGGNAPRPPGPERRTVASELAPVRLTNGTYIYATACSNSRLSAALCFQSVEAG